MKLTDEQKLDKHLALVDLLNMEVKGLRSLRIYVYKEKKMTPYQLRKKWRIKLHANRCKDNDQSVERYHHDAAVLNKAMDKYKVEGRRATW